MRGLHRQPSPIRRAMVPLRKSLVFAVCGLLALGTILIMLGVGGVRSPLPDAEITHQIPYANFVGREYRVTSEVAAYAWNDFPDKTKILSISLLPAPGIRNRFVSWVKPLKAGQRIRIVTARRHFTLLGSTAYYVVIVPDAGLPDGIDVTMNVNSDAIPDPLVYVPIDR